MSGQAQLNLYDHAVLFAYLVATVALGLWVSRRGMKASRDYFLDGRGLPWHVVGASMVAGSPRGRPVTY